MPQRVPSSAMSAATTTPTRVLLVCSGLDHVHRGFESFARESFAALRDEPRLDLQLIKGSGPAGPAERSVPTLRREAALARALGRLWGREPFRVEQLAFGASLLPVIARRRPDVVYLSEWHTSHVLAAYRRCSGQRFRLAFCNGAMAADRFGHLDRVQQLTPVALEAALDRGDRRDRHMLLPLGFNLAPRFRPTASEERMALRARLGLPDDRQIVLSVAALNRHHKRLDYLIEEVARLPEPRPYLALLGEPEGETAGLRAMARSRLGENGCCIRTVTAQEVSDFYRAADVLVLASLGEAFGRVLVEAMAEGLLCVAHDFPVTRYVMGDHGLLADLSQPGALAELLPAAGRAGPSAAAARHQFVYDRFSWDRLRPAYVAFLEEAAGRSDSAPRGGEEHRLLLDG